MSIHSRNSPPSSAATGKGCRCLAPINRLARFGSISLTNPMALLTTTMTPESKEAQI